ncbi:helix-turn-helix domain-containing protein [Stutzerimonas stutzeri]|uniref:helix-turn-helix domain-containing protein n=1 Tax=Stutzerimonas stutzeri TaxID=316 RepID=UPI003C2C1422
MTDPKLRPGELIRKKRTGLGWTQEQLAKKAGVSAHTVMRVEKGRGVDWMLMVALLDSVHAEVIVR